jgi:phosphonopyruvate decarboxylase
VIEPAEFYQALRRNNLTFFTGVPDSLLKDLCAFITDEVPPDQHVINANEGSAVALAAGYHMATGRIPVVYLQNSGTGNAINPLLSLADPAVYAIPILFIIGWRGEPGVPDEPQHVTQGRVMPELLTAIGLEYDVIAADQQDFDQIIERACARMRSTGRSHALLVRKNTFAPYRPRSADSSDRTFTRSDAIEVVLGHMAASDLLVSTTGMTSREVFAYRERRGETHDRDFLTVGSMGHASQIALGLAQHRASRRVVCLDGDGAVIMHMGSLAIIGTQRPANLRHIVLNNGAHDSVGGQPTAGGQINLAAMALACGYRHAEVADGREETEAAVDRVMDRPGPVMLEIRIASQPHTDAGRPTTTPVQNKTGFMNALDREPD